MATSPAVLRQLSGGRSLLDELVGADPSDRQLASPAEIDRTDPGERFNICGPASKPTLRYKYSYGDYQGNLFFTNFDFAARLPVSAGQTVRKDLQVTWV